MLLILMRSVCGLLMDGKYIGIQLLSICRLGYGSGMWICQCAKNQLNFEQKYRAGVDAGNAVVVAVCFRCSYCYCLSVNGLCCCNAIDGIIVYGTNDCASRGNWQW